LLTSFFSTVQGHSSRCGIPQSPGSDRGQDVKLARADDGVDFAGMADVLSSGKTKSAMRLKAATARKKGPTIYA